MKTNLIASILAVSSIARVAGARADDGETESSPARYSLDIGSHVRWLGDTSAAIVTDEEMAGVRLTAGRSITRTSVASRELELGGFVRYAYTGASGTMFGNLDTSIGQHLVGAGARADAPLKRWFLLNAQAELGMARTSLRVEQDEMTPADDAHWAPYALASLGAEVRVPGKRVQLSLGVDVGYLVTVPVELHALPGDRPDEALSIETSFAGIGKLDTRGFVYSMAFRGRF